MNIQPLLTALKNIFVTAYQDDKAAVKDIALDYFNSSEVSLAKLATQAALGEVDKDFVIARLKDEKDIMESQLLSMKILAESDAQSLAINTMEIITAAILAALPKPTES